MLVFGNWLSGIQNDVVGLTMSPSPTWETVASGVFAPQGGSDFYYAASADVGRGRM